jgi:hypothetical protein
VSEEKKSRLRIKVPWFMIGVITAVGVASCSYRLWVVGKIHKGIEEIQARGEPTSLKQLESWYPEVPFKENAALVYLSAFSKLSPTDRQIPRALFKEIAALDACTALSESNRVAVRRLLEPNRNALDLLHQGATLSKSRYPINLRARNVDTPHLAGIWDASNLLCLAAAWHAETGNTDEAVRCVKTVLALGRSLAAEPLLPSQRFRVRCNQFAVEFLERLLNRATPSDAQLLDLQASFRLAAEPVDFVPVFYGERCLGLAADHRSFVRKLMQSRWKAELVYSFLKVGGRIEADRLFWLEQLNCYVESATRPYPERVVFNRRFEEGRYQRAKKQLCMVSAYFLSDYQAITDAEGESIARLRVAQGAIDAERFRARHGNYPQTLAVLDDPFDGKPLRTKTEGDTFTIYSIGKDLIENDGRSREDGQSYYSEYDLTFTLRR